MRTCFFFATVRGKRVIFVITFDAPASEKTHDDNKKVRMTNLVVRVVQVRESQYRSFKVKGLREATANSGTAQQVFEWGG